MSEAGNLNDIHHRDTVPRWRPLCWKRRDGRTRAHHRLCGKRGGKLERWRSAWAAEVLASARCERSPDRLRGTMRAQAQAYGQLWRDTEASVVATMREMSPLTASLHGLKDIATMLGVA